ncbi:MAG: DUF4442 domain-containing protein [Bacteroidetes bacterium]|nr:MAG: DUF4442 domain-containing protein [Bacteroidota bacterium]
MEMNSKQDKLLSRLRNKWVFRLFTRKMVPAAARAGVRFVEMDGEKCTILVPNLKRNRNPFRSMYFAVQSMGAEMSTALLAMFHLEAHHASIAWIVIDFKADFPTKATSDVTFTCVDGEKVREAIQRAAEGEEAQVVELKTVGTTSDGTVVSNFQFRWSFKKRG